MGGVDCYSVLSPGSRSSSHSLAAWFKSLARYSPPPDSSNRLCLLAVTRRSGLHRSPPFTPHVLNATGLHVHTLSCCTGQTRRREKTAIERPRVRRENKGTGGGGGTEIKQGGMRTLEINKQINKYTFLIMKLLLHLNYLNK